MRKAFLLLLAVFVAWAPAAAQLGIGLPGPAISTTPTVPTDQYWTGIINADRAIDWTTVGIPGGVPVRSTVCTTIAAVTYGDGAVDATAGIQAALAACPANQVVLLGAGEFRVNTNLTIPSNKLLRGAAPSTTVLKFYGAADAAVTLGTPSEPASGTSNAITGGATQGSTSITVSGSGIATGQLLMISQQDLFYMTDVGSGGTCSWCDGGFPGSSNSGQTVLVTNVVGSTITFTPPLYIAYTSSPVAYRFAVGGTNAGLENLQLYAQDTGYNNMIFGAGVTYSWVKGVEVNFADFGHMELRYSLGNIVRDSYFHDGFDHAPGTYDDQLNLNFKTSSTLVINNIFYRMHVSVMLEWGASGNVIAYNFSTGNYHDTSLVWLINDFNFHGAHPMMNLFEGNIGIKYQMDSTWGSSSHSSLFRNWFKGSNQYVPPQNSRGNLDLGMAAQETSNTYAGSIDYLSQYNNLVGNLWGSDYLVVTAGAVGKLVPPAVSSGVPACLRVSYNSDNDAPVTPAWAESTMTYRSLFDCDTGMWSSTSGPTLPPSFFLPAKPAFFDVATPWPGIGPDITGGDEADTTVNGHVNKNPAMLCFEAMGAVQAAPLVFSAANCPYL